MDVVCVLSLSPSSPEVLNTSSSATAWSYSSWEIIPCSSMAWRINSWRSLLYCAVVLVSPVSASVISRLLRGSYLEGLLVMAIKLAHSARESSDTCFPK